MFVGWLQQHSYWVGEREECFSKSSKFLLSSMSGPNWITSPHLITVAKENLDSDCWRLIPEPISSKDDGIFMILKSRFRTWGQIWALGSQIQCPLVKTWVLTLNSLCAWTSYTTLLNLVNSFICKRGIKMNWDTQRKKKTKDFIEGLVCSKYPVNCYCHYYYSTIYFHIT